MSDETGGAKERSLRVALGGAGEAVVTTDLAGRIDFMNPAAERITGWTLAEGTGAALGEVFRTLEEKSRAPVEDPALRAIADGLALGAPTRAILIRSDGTELPIEESVAAIRGDDERIRGAVVVFREVGERAAKEAGSRESEDTFRRLVAGIQDYAIFMLDPEGIVTTWNTGAERIKGYRAEEIIGKHFSIFYGPEAVRAAWPQHELELATTEGRFEDEGWRVRKDGSRFWASVVLTAVRDAQGSLKGFAKVTRDLTQRMQQETSIRESELRYRKVFEAARDAILILDAESGTIVESNPQVSALFGYGRHELFGKVLWDTSLFEDPESRRAAQEQLQDQAGRRFADVWLRAKDGRKAFCEFVGTTYRVGDSVLIQCNLRDITETRQLFQAKVEARALADINRRKDEFLAMLSHELRNPLSPIVNALHILRLGGEDAVLQAQARRIIERQTGQLTRLVDDLLDVSRINTGRIQLQRTHVDLREIVGLAREAVRPMIEERRHELVATLPDDPVWVLADRTRIEQVIVNLVTNAAKYTENRGRIEIVVREQEDEAVLSVKDNGTGITRQLLPRVFELFTQGERDSDRKLGGLGVGLTIVHKIVEMHQGRVEARSEGKGQGSEFVVTLPRSAPPADEPLPFATPAAPAKAQSRRVLVVDDNEDTARTVALILRGAGHEVRLAHSGQQALETASNFRPAAVILDLGLPGMDGYEVARRMRENPKLAGVLLIAVSGYAQESDRRRSKEAGVDLHLAKPVEPDKIEEILANLG